MSYIGGNIKEYLSRQNKDDLETAVNNLEQTAGVPIRFTMPGQTRRLSTALEPWTGATADMAHYPGHTEEERDTEGITIYCQSHNADAFDSPLWRYQRYTLDSSYWLNWTYDEPAVVEFEVPGAATAEAIEAAGGIPLVATDGEHPYAEIYENGRAVYFRFNPSNFTNTARANWQTLLFDAIIENISPEARAEAQARRRAQVRETFQSLMIDQGNQEREQLRGRIDEMAVRVAEREETLVSERTRYNELNRQLAWFIENEGEMSEEQIQREWDALERHTKIEHFTLGQTGENRWLKFTTEFLYLDHPVTGRKIPLGEYDVTLNFGRGYIRVNNKTQKFGGWDHPHIEQGRICAGEFATTLTTLLQERKLAGLSNILFSIFGTLTMNDNVAVNNCSQFIAADDERRRQNNWPAWTEGEAEHPMVLAQQEAG